MKKNNHTQTPLELVKEIHNAVSTASDNCLIEAKKILKLAQDKDNLVVFEKTAKLGFSKVKEITQISTLKTQSDLINGYLLRYPHLKFISTEAIDEICTKYNLILGPDQHFIGSMPVRSMKQIIDFKLNQVDEIYYKGNFRTLNPGIVESEGVIDWVEIAKNDYNIQTDNGKNLIQDGRRTHYISNKDYFMVMAPVEMFESEGMVKEGNELKKLVTCDDPACLKVVKGGYLIVALWGEEAAIEKMQNPKMN